MIDVQTAKNAYPAHEISNAEFLRSHHNPADGLTKIKKSTALEKLVFIGNATLSLNNG